MKLRWFIVRHKLSKIRRSCDMITSNDAESKSNGRHLGSTILNFYKCVRKAPELSQNLSKSKKKKYKSYRKMKLTPNTLKVLFQTLGQHACHPSHPSPLLHIPVGIGLMFNFTVLFLYSCPYIPAFVNTLEPANKKDIVAYLKFTSPKYA